MKKPSYVKISNPCHEDWEKMTSMEKGRFCESCTTLVQDFSNMTDTQIVEYFKNKPGKTCGRFRNEQLMRPLEPIVIKRFSVFRQFGLWLGVILLGFPRGYSGQRNSKPNAQISRTMRSAHDDIYGVITDAQNGEPLANVKISIKGCVDSLITGDDGTFLIPYKALTDTNRLVLELEKEGYVSVEFKSELANLEAVNGIQMDPKMPSEALINLRDTLIANPPLISEEYGYTEGEVMYEKGDIDYITDDSAILEKVTQTVQVKNNRGGLLKDAWIEINTGKALLSARTDSKGMATFQLNKNEEYAFRIGCPGYKVLEINQQIKGRKPLVFVLEPQIMVMGKMRIDHN